MQNQRFGDSEKNPHNFKLLIDWKRTGENLCHLPHKFICPFVHSFLYIYNLSPRTLFNLCTNTKSSTYLYTWVKAPLLMAVRLGSHSSFNAQLISTLGMQFNSQSIHSVISKPALFFFFSHYVAACVNVKVIIH